jgi:isoleucyl-tRNA synthetase
MKAIAALVAQFSQDDIAKVEANKGWSGVIEGAEINLDMADFEIVAQDIPGWLVSSVDGITVALDSTITEELKQEGIARELINRVLNLRKDSGLEVTDKIVLKIDTTEEIRQAVAANIAHVCNEILAVDIVFESLNGDALNIDLETESDAKISIQKN